MIIIILYYSIILYYYICYFPGKYEKVGTKWYQQLICTSFHYLFQTPESVTGISELKDVVAKNSELYASLQHPSPASDLKPFVIIEGLDATGTKYA